MRLHKADVDEKAMEVLQSESPTEHPVYWDVVRVHAHSHAPSMEMTVFKRVCPFPLVNAGAELRAAG